MKKLSVMLCAILLLAAMVLPVSAGSMDSVWEGLKLEEYHLFARGDLDAYHMRGFDITEDGKYILGGVLNPKGQSTLEKIDVEKKASVANYQHKEEDGLISYVKGVDIDDRGYVYGGIANNANNGAVYFAIIKLDDMKQVYSEKIEIADKVGINGTYVSKINGRYYLYFVVNYNTDRIYCYDVTDVNAPKINTAFGDNKGYMDLTKLDIDEGNYMAVDDKGVIYLAAKTKSDKKTYLMQLSPDGKTITQKNQIDGIYGVDIYRDYLICTNNTKGKTEVYAIDKATLKIVATIKDTSGDMAAYYPYAVVAGDRIWTVEADYLSIGERIMRTPEIKFPAETKAPETTKVPETTKAPVTTKAPAATTKAPVVTPATADNGMIFAAAAMMAVAACVCLKKRAK